MEGEISVANIGLIIASIGLIIVGIAATILVIIGMWKTFAKAGQPGWGCFIPVYNIYLVLKIAGKPEWWLILWLFVPIVNFVISIITYVDFAKRFGKSGGFGIGLFFLPAIFFLILGFGSAEYLEAT